MVWSRWASVAARAVRHATASARSAPGSRDATAHAAHLPRRRAPIASASRELRGDASGEPPLPWDAPVTRVEAGVGYYLQRNLVVRATAQRNWRDGGRVHDRTFLSAQLAYWF